MPLKKYKEYIVKTNCKSCGSEIKYDDSNSPPALCGTCKAKGKRSHDVIEGKDASRVDSDSRGHPRPRAAIGF